MKTLIEKIRFARVGKECREPIAQALLILYGLFNTKVENAEVVAARGSESDMFGFQTAYATLDERIDAEEKLHESYSEEVETYVANYKIAFGE